MQRKVYIVLEVVLLLILCLLQAVSPFGVSTQMSGYSKDFGSLSPKDFVKMSLQYVRAGDKTYGSIRHIVMVGLTAYRGYHLMILTNDLT